jgi:hypothetical protein
MRNSFKALLVLVVVLACSASAASAAAPLPTRAPHVISTRAAWVGQVDATTLAFGSNTLGSAAEVLPDGTGTPRAVTPPAGCGAVAAGSGHLLFACPPHVGSEARSAIVTAPDGTVQATLDYTLPAEPADSRPAPDPDAIGAMWFGNGTQFVDWHTGALYGEGRSFASPPDVDAPGLLGSPCAPWGAEVTAQASGAWVLTPAPGPFPRGAVWALHHCGSSKTYKMPGRLRPLALRGGWLVLWRPTHDAVGAPAAQLVLQRLRDGHRWALNGNRSVQVQRLRFAATAHRLLILGEGESTHPVQSVILPQR